MAASPRAGPALALAAFSLVVFAAALSANERAAGPAPAVVPVLDAWRYTGTWFELARLPGAPWRRCAADVTATYSLRADGRYDVTGRCLRHDGRLAVLRGEARVHRGDPGRLEANFLPRWLRALRLGWNDHWIVALDPDYRIVVVSDRARHDLRVLSRVPELELERLAPVLARLRAQGFAVDRLVRTPQAGAGLVPARTVTVMT